MSTVESYSGQNALYGKPFTALLIKSIMTLEKAHDLVTSTLIYKLITEECPELPKDQAAPLKKRAQRTLSQLAEAGIIDRKEHFNKSKIRYYTYKYVW